MEMVPTFDDKDIRLKKTARRLLSQKRFVNKLSVYTSKPILDAYNTFYSLLNDENVTPLSLFVLAHVMREFIYCLLQDETALQIETPYLHPLMRKMSKRHISKIQEENEDFEFVDDRKKVQWLGTEFNSDTTDDLIVACERLDWRGFLGKLNRYLDSQRQRKCPLFLYLNGGSTLTEDELSELIGSIKKRNNKKFVGLAHLKYSKYTLDKDKEEQMKNFLTEVEGFFDDLDSLRVSQLETIATSELIDNFIGEGSKTPDILDAIGNNMILLDYFLKQLDAENLSVLSQTNIFKEIPNIDNQLYLPSDAFWPQGVYLLKIADSAPIEVSKVLQTFSFRENKNYKAKEIYLKILVSLYEHVDISKLLSPIYEEGWIRNGSLWTLGIYPLKEIISLLVEKGEYEGMKNLVSEICSLTPLDYTIKDKEENFKNASPVLKDYLLMDILEDLSKWSKDTSILEALIPVVGEYIYQSQYLKGNDPERERDYTYIRYDDLEDFGNEYKQFDRELINTVVKQSLLHFPSQTDDLIEDLLTWNIEYDFFIRLRLLVYSEEPQKHIKTVGKYLLSQFNIHEVQREYFKLLHNSYKFLDLEVKTELLSQVDELDASEKDENKYYLARYFSAVEEFLSSDQKNKYADFLNQGVSYDTPAFKTITRTAVDTPPFNTEEIGAWSIEEVFEKIHSFIEEKEAEWIGKPTERGFVNALSLDFDKRFSMYVENIALFYTLFEKSEYIKEFIKIAFRRDLGISEFKSVLKLLSEFLKYLSELESWDIKDYNNSLFLITDYLEDYLAQHINISFIDTNNLLEEILKLIGESDKNNIDSKNYYDRAINSIQGHVFSSFFRLILNKGVNDTEKLKLSEFLKQNIKSENNIVNAVTGRFFPFLYNSHKELYEHIKETTFLNDQAFISVWSGFTAVSSVYKENFKDMLSAYKFLLDHFEEVNSLEWQDRMDERIIEHFVLAYLYFWDDISASKDYFYELLTKINDMQITHIIHFVSMQLKNQKKNTADISVVKNIWEFFLQEQKYEKIYTDLGSWFKPDFFKGEEDWLLDVLKRTLEKTGGSLEDNYYLEEELIKLLGFNDSVLLECIELLSKEPSRNYFLFEKNSREINNLLFSIKEKNEDLEKPVKEISETLYSKGFTAFRNLGRINTE